MQLAKRQTQEYDRDIMQERAFAQLKIIKKNPILYKSASDHLDEEIDWKAPVNPNFV